MRRLILFLVLVALVAGGAVAVERARHRDSSRLGSDQPLAIGSGVSLAPRIGTPATAFDVAAGVPVAGQLSIRTNQQVIQRRTHDGRVGLNITVLLDLRSVLLIDGATTQQFVVNVKQENSRDFRFNLPSLEPGHHCLVVAALEEPIAKPTRNTNLVHHGEFAVDFSAGTGTQDYCQASHDAVAAVANNAVVACDSAVLSPVPDTTRAGGRLPAGAPLWAQVPAPCPTTNALSIVYYGGALPVLTGVLEPVRFPLDSNKHMIALGSMPSGPWWIMLVASGKRTRARVGPWVLIG